MRRLDYWLGVPACFLLTMLRGVRLALGGRRGPDDRPPENVLFIELAEMGTAVLAHPSMHRLQAMHPECRLFFLVFKHIDDSIKVLGVIPDDHVLTIDASTLWTLARDTVRFMWVARRHRIDTTINLEVFTRYSTLLAVLSGARRRVGFHRPTNDGLYLGRLLTHEVSYNPHLHTWQSLVTLVLALAEPPARVPLGKFPAPAEPVLPRVPGTAEASRRIWHALTRDHPAVEGKRLIVVNPNASELIPVRRWPLDRYAALVDRLVADPRNACVITGSTRDEPDARFIANRVASDRVVNFAGRTSLRDLLDLFHVAPLLITNDSGPAHLAALTSIHVLVLFGPETPDLYRPLTDNCTVLYARYACSPCVSAYNQRHVTCRDNQCLQSFSVDDVFAEVQRILD